MHIVCSLLPLNKIASLYNLMLKFAKKQLDAQLLDATSYPSTLVSVSPRLRQLLDFKFDATFYSICSLNFMEMLPPPALPLGMFSF